jgi:hypothetical protein
MSSSPVSVMVLSECMTSAKSLPLPWSKSGKNTNSGSRTCTYSVVVSVSLSVVVAVEKSSYGISAWTRASRQYWLRRIICVRSASMNMRPSLQRKCSTSMWLHVLTDASGTQKHRVKIFNINSGQPVSYFEPYSGFLRDRSAPISATAFHPHRLMIAAAALHDNHVNIFACNGGSKQATVKSVKLWDGAGSASRPGTLS